MIINSYIKKEDVFHTFNNLSIDSTVIQSKTTEK